MPVLIATDYSVLFACYLPTDDDQVVVAEFERCSSVRFGMPNDEVIYSTMGVLGRRSGADLLNFTNARSLAPEKGTHVAY